METHFSQLSDHLYVHHGHVNTGILRDGDRALLIDPSGPTFHLTLGELGITNAEQMLFTHHHRDNTLGFPIADNVRIGVPEKRGSMVLPRSKPFGTIPNTDGTSTTTIHTI